MEQVNFNKVLFGYNFKCLAQARVKGGMFFGLFFSFFSFSSSVAKNSLESYV